MNNPVEALRELAASLRVHGRADDLNALAENKRLKHSEREAVVAIQEVAMKVASALEALAAQSGAQAAELVASDRVLCSRCAQVEVVELSGNPGKLTDEEMADCGLLSETHEARTSTAVPQDARPNVPAAQSGAAPVAVLTEDQVNEAVRAYVQAGKRGVNGIQEAMRCALEAAVIAPAPTPVPRALSDAEIDAIFLACGGCWGTTLQGPNHNVFARAVLAARETGEPE